MISGDSRILIVDDEPDVCFLLGRILTRRRILNRCVSNLAEAAENMKQFPPDLVFLDNNLPDGRGIDFIPIMKTMCPGAKVVMVTANDTPSDLSNAYLSGADFFIGKPLNTELINKTIDRLL